MPNPLRQSAELGLGLSGNGQPFQWRAKVGRLTPATLLKYI